MLTRRKLMFGAALGVAAVASRFALRRRGPRSALRGPRYWIQLVPGGGIDAVLTTDPREPKNVKAGVDVPYRPDEIVDAHGMQLGPHFKALAPWSSRLAVVNGVRVNTANHHTGMEQIVRLRTRTTWHSSSAFEILAAHREGQAVGTVSLGTGNATAFTENYLGMPSPFLYGSKVDLFTVLDDMSPEDLALAAATVERHAASTGRAGAGIVDRKRLTALEDGARLFHRLVDTPKFTKVAWQTGDAAAADAKTGHGENLQRALWLIENDLASSVTVQCFVIWDSHYDNPHKQGTNNPILASNLAKLFEELDKRSNKYGKLSDQVAVVVGSEIGRFPYMNLSKGKDHYPQAPLMFYGKWFNTGASYGSTDGELNSGPISLATGRADRSGKKIVLDDVGATVLRLGGLDPEIYGFVGDHLDFLVAT